MKSFMKKIDLFCYRHPRFGIPNLMLYIVLANAALWLLSAMAAKIRNARSFSFFVPFIRGGLLMLVYAEYLWPIISKPPEFYQNLF